MYKTENVFHIPAHYYLWSVRSHLQWYNTTPPYCLLNLADIVKPKVMTINKNDWHHSAQLTQPLHSSFDTSKAVVILCFNHTPISGK